MESLLYFMLWAGVFLLLMRFGCGAHVMGHGHGHARHGQREEGAPRDSRQTGWVAPDTDVDPVCGKTVRTDAAKSAVHAGTVYHFCSSDCRERFEASPERYVGPQPDRQSGEMNHGHG